MSKASFRYHYFPERREWIGIVVKDGVAITVAAETTKEEILAWWERYCETGEETDQYGRSTKQ